MRDAQDVYLCHFIEGREKSEHCIDFDGGGEAQEGAGVMEALAE